MLGTSATRGLDPGGAVLPSAPLLLVPQTRDSFLGDYAPSPGDTGSIWRGFGLSQLGVGGTAGIRRVEARVLLPNPQGTGRPRAQHHVADGSMAPCWRA